MKSKKTKTPKLGKPIVKVAMIEYLDEHYYDAIDRAGNHHDAIGTTSVLNVSPKPGLDRWRGDVGNAEADRRMHKAMDKGTRIHHGCFNLANGIPVVYQAPWGNAETISPKDLKKLKKQNPNLIVLNAQDEAVACWRFQRVLDMVKPIIIASELRVAIPVTLRKGEPDEKIIWTGGSMDHLWHVKAGSYAINGRNPLVIPIDGNYVWDLKSGNQYDEHPVQIGHYSEMTEYTYPGFNIAGGIVLYLESGTKTGIPGVSAQFYDRQALKKQDRIFSELLAVWDWKNPKATREAFEFPNILYPYGIPIETVKPKITGTGKAEKETTKQLKESLKQKKQLEKAYDVLATPPVEVSKKKNGKSSSYSITAIDGKGRDVTNKKYEKHIKATTGTLVLSKRPRTKAPAPGQLELATGETKS